MDTRNLLRLLNEHQVKFVLIGATAGVAHGYVRLTKDIDLFVEPTQENMEKVFKALREFGYDLKDTSIAEALQKKLLFRGYILRTDIHPSAKGVEWHTLWKNKVAFKFEGEEVYFSSLDDLISMKKAAGRPQDLEDLRHLEEIKRQLKGRK
jgi:predicted nucleotidyltransferase